MHDLALLRK